jgi:hypothetical protein
MKWRAARSIHDNQPGQSEEAMTQSSRDGPIPMVHVDMVIGAVTAVGTLSPAIAHAEEALDSTPVRWARAKAWICRSRPDNRSWLAGIGLVGARRRPPAPWNRPIQLGSVSRFLDLPTPHTLLASRRHVRCFLLCQEQSELIHTQSIQPFQTEIQ